MASSFDTFVISLPGAVERRAGLPSLPGAKPWAAFDGKSIKPDDMHQVAGFLCRTGVTCTPGMVGCYVSHLSLWFHLASRPDDEPVWTLVLEDDARPRDQDTLSAVRSAVLDAPAASVINLADPSACSHRGPARLERTRLMVTTCAYLVSKGAARRLVQVFEHRIRYHVDATMTWHSLLGELDVFRAVPCMFVQDDSLGSSVSPRTLPLLLPKLLGGRPELTGTMVVGLNACSLIYVAAVAAALASRSGVVTGLVITALVAEAVVYFGR